MVIPLFYPLMKICPRVRRLKHSLRRRACLQILSFCSCGQLHHQAAGGCSFLRGRRDQQRSAGAGRGDEQSQPRETETDERTEHSQTGPIQTPFGGFIVKQEVTEASCVTLFIFLDLWYPEDPLQGPGWRGGSSAASGGAGGPEELSVPVHVQALLQSPATLPGGLPQEPGEEQGYHKYACSKYCTTYGLEV